MDRVLIDSGCGAIIDGLKTIEESAERILNYVISVASDEQQLKAIHLGQDDFIPWKKGISL